MEPNIMFCLHLVENSITDKRLRFTVQEEVKILFIVGILKGSLII